MKQKKYKFQGESRTLAEWARKFGIPYNVLFMRIREGWSFSRAVEQPVRSHKSSDAAKGKKSSKKGNTNAKKPPEESAPTDKPKKRRVVARKTRREEDPAVAPDAPQAGVQAPEAPPQPSPAPSEEKDSVVPNKPRVMSKDFLRGMAEGIWLTISSVAMTLVSTMMSHIGDSSSSKAIREVKNLFRQPFGV